jgi:hypothetical protein
VHHKHHTAKAYALHQLEKCCTFKTTSCQNLKICEISKGVSKIIPWSSHLKSSFVYKRLWNSVCSFPFFVMVYWKSLSIWSLAVNHDDLAASIPFPASQVETVQVETFLLSSQGSRIVNMEKSSIVYSSLVRASNPQNRTRKYAQDRSKQFATLLFVAIANTNRCTLSFSRFAPHHGRLFRLLSPIVIGVTVMRRHDVALPRFPQPYSRRRDRVSWPCWASCCPHQIPDWVNWPLLPRIGYKMEPFTGTADTKAPISLRARQYHCSCFSSS